MYKVGISYFNKSEMFLAKWCYNVFYFTNYCNLTGPVDVFSNSDIFLCIHCFTNSLAALFSPEDCCILCKSSVDDGQRLGEKRTIDDVTIHYFCAVRIHD